MSTMVTPDLLPEFLLAKVTKCSGCEANRRPRMFLCTYHEGFWDGWDTAERLTASEASRGVGATTDRPGPTSQPPTSVSGPDLSRSTGADPSPGVGPDHG